MPRITSIAARFWPWLARIKVRWKRMVKPNAAGCARMMQDAVAIYEHQVTINANWKATPEDCFLYV